MNVQEQEERDYFPATDHQNAFAVSRQRFNQETARDRGLIQAAISRGESVVVAWSLAHCPMTDAAMGDRMTFLSSHANPQDAMDRLHQLNRDEPGGDECGYAILGPRACPAVVASQADDPTPF